MKILKNIFVLGFFTIIFSSLFFFETSFAQEPIQVKSIQFENTWIIKLTNNDDEPVKSFKLWSGDGSAFQSAKTEIGWSVEKLTTGVLVFTSDNSFRFMFSSSERENPSKVVSRP